MTTGITGLSISRKKLHHPGLDQAALYALGLEHVRELSRRVWTDHNIHDPGITTLELLCYALTDLTYRATLPLTDILASSVGGEVGEPSDTTWTARQILPCEPWTELDHRKIIVDLPGIANAWLQPAVIAYVADTVKGELLHPATLGGVSDPRYREVRLRGVYDVLVEMEPTKDGEEVSARLEEVRRILRSRRSLCEDFAKVTLVEPEMFVLCGELELAPDADPRQVWAEALFRVQTYLTPPVRNYTLEERLSHVREDGSRLTVPEVFEGPLLQNGFIDDTELAAADLRAEIRLSDVIGIVMDVPGVRAVRDMLIHQADLDSPLADRWVVSVTSGRQPRLNRELCRLVMYKRDIPTAVSSAFPEILEDAEARYRDLAAAARKKSETPREDDVPVPRGRPRDLRRYTSFQRHFPAIYGLSDAGSPSGATPEREAKILQLKAYLLFFDQVMANYLAQLSQVKKLFSTEPDLVQTYFHQLVTDFKHHDKIYDADMLMSGLDALFVGKASPAEEVSIERRNRFLDHLISRFAERFHDYASIVRERRFADDRTLAAQKCGFLRSYPEISRRRGAAFDATTRDEKKLWDPEKIEDHNLPGLAARIAKLLAIVDPSRRALSELGPDQEGLFVIENILLRPFVEGDPFLHVCPDPGCADCLEMDPYSYRIHVLFPAYAGRFRDMDFRRFVEEVVRRETPAHVLPKICWISDEDMVLVQVAYHDWLRMVSGIAPENRPQKTQALIDALRNAKNVYQTATLAECDAPEGQDKFILGRTALGSIEKNQPE